jgi:hypothetical protein
MLSIAIILLSILIIALISLMGVKVVTCPHCVDEPLDWAIIATYLIAALIALLLMGTYLLKGDGLDADDLSGRFLYHDTPRKRPNNAGAEVPTPARSRSRTTPTSTLKALTSRLEDVEMDELFPRGTASGESAAKMPKKVKFTN